MEALMIFLLLFIPVILVASYVFVAKREYERASLRKKVKYRFRRKR